MNSASGSQLSQSRPSGTSAVTSFTATLRTEITLIVVANTTGSSANFSIYHDDDGTTYDATTALYEANAQAPSSSSRLVFEVGSGVMVSPGGTIGVKTGTGSALTFTLYGHTGAIA